MSIWTERREKPGKPELVMLHGWGMSSAVWGSFADKLNQYFSLTLIDLPALGNSSSAPIPYTSAAIAELLKDLVPERAVWLGWSMGGQIAMTFSALYPEKVERLITLASNPCFVQRTDWSFAMPEETHSQFEASLAANEAKTLTRFIMLQTQGAEKGKEALKVLKEVLAETEHADAALSLSPLREDVRSQLAALSLPILQVFGEKDHLVPNEAAQGCEAITGQQTITYKGAGHLPFFSHQDLLINDLVNFCQCGD